ncbi:MAG: accessory gene regulator B family protein [Lachnospiraceae bacterium]|nr:accessory gene regulator B family protein [Lachnospiraceae bacterium]
MQLLTKLIYQNESIPEEQKKYVLFHIKCFLYDGSKFLLFLLFFLFINRLDMYIYAFIIMLPLRLTSGGLHFKHYWSCLLFSFGYMLLATVPLATVRLPYGVSIIMLLLCIVINGSIGPICSASRPALPQQEIILARKKAIMLTVYATILTILFWDTTLAPVGFWSIILHSLQLLIGNMIKKRGEKIC